MVAEAVNAKVTGKVAEDVVLFCGAGTTAAVAKLVGILGLNQMPSGGEGDVGEGGGEGTVAVRRPVVLVGPMEHHSNLLPWRESAAEVHTVRSNATGRVDLAHLEELLRLHAGAPLLVGTFTAASNVTGLVEDVDAVTALLHAHGALSFWDYASAAPYVKVDMNPTSSEALRKDAVFFSPHKFVGGVNTPGVLVVKKRLLGNAVPSEPGGGTVFYVTDSHHRYLSNREEREEGGTPDIVGAARVALCLKLKRLAAPLVPAAHAAHLSAGLTALRAAAPALVLLGDAGPSAGPAADDAAVRLPVFSFLVRWADPGAARAGSGTGGRFLHYNFVCALLNDLFGVQSRGGCQCAGPYSQRLLGLSRSGSHGLEQCLLEEKAEVLRPGYSRLSLPYAMSPAEVDYVLACVAFVARRGWLFLPQYRLEFKTGECKHRSRATRFPERRWLSHFSLNGLDSSGSSAGARRSGGGSGSGAGSGAGSGLASLSEGGLAALFAGHLAEAHALADALESGRTAVAAVDKGRVSASAGQDLGLSDAAMAVRWFALPSEAAAVLATIRGGAAGGGPGGGEPYLSSLPSGPVQPPAMLINAAASAKLRAAQEAAVAEAAAATGQPVGLKSGHFKYPARPSAGSLPPSPPWADPVVTGKMVHGSAHAVAHAATPNTYHGVLLREATERAADGRKPMDGPTDEPTDEPTDGGNTNGGAGAAVGEEAGKVAYAAEEAAAAAVVVPAKLPVPPKKVMRAIGQAIRDWRMVEGGDKLVVGLSGGKDSLTLLFALLDLQRRAPVKFEVAAATVDPMTPSFDPSPLKAYLEALGVTYHYLANPIVDRAAAGQLSGDSLCSFCSRMKRGLLYGCCREFGYTKLVLGQHLDDLAESLLMSTLHNGQVRTMKANYRIEAGDVSVIRPLIYVREHMTKEFAVAAKLPIINENCPACFEQPKERHRVKKMLAREEALAPEIFPNLKAALLPFMSEGVYPYMELQRGTVAANGLDSRTLRSQKGHIDKHKGGLAEGGAAAEGGAVKAGGGGGSGTGVGAGAESVKWGASCLAVLPDAWLEEEAARRKRARSERGEGGGLGEETAAAAIQVNMPGSKVMLCNTGKCEMFD